MSIMMIMMMIMITESRYELSERLLAPLLAASPILLAVSYSMMMMMIVI